MAKYLTYQMHTDITKALKRYNDMTASNTFSTLDGNILCMVKSFADKNLDFFMSEKEIAENNITSISTVQRSIKRLCEAGLLKREKDYAEGKGKRLLIYQYSAVQELIDAK